VSRQEDTTRRRRETLRRECYQRSPHGRIVNCREETQQPAASHNPIPLHGPCQLARVSHTPQTYRKIRLDNWCHFMIIYFIIWGGYIPTSSKQRTPPMTIRTTKNDITMMCDRGGCNEFIEDEDFNRLLATSKHNRWKAIKNSQNKWVHYCPQCRERIRVRNPRVIQNAEQYLHSLQTKRKSTVP